MELQYGRVTERDQSNPADSWTVTRAVDVQRLNDETYELSHQLEVAELNAARRVKCEHHVSTIWTSYKRVTSGNICSLLVQNGQMYLFEILLSRVLSVGNPETKSKLY